MEAKPVLAKLEYEGEAQLVLVIRVPIDMSAVVERIGRAAAKAEQQKPIIHHPV